MVEDLLSIQKALDLDIFFFSFPLTFTLEWWSGLEQSRIKGGQAL